MDVDLQLFKNIMAESRHNSDLLDSYSPNQFKSKDVLINHINGLNILNDKSEIIILGSWYGSILIPALDLDENVISIAKNRLFNHYKNVDFICDDVFKWIPDSRRTKKTDLIINTSCEHMRPMKELDLNTNAYFAFQSNNMFDIPTHNNCVNNIEEFKEQMPSNAKIMIEDHIKDDRGTRFLLIGQL
jgi:hypothetical protein